MFCRHCGSEISDDSKFCNLCGKNLEEEKSENNNIVSAVSPVLPNENENKSEPKAGNKNNKKAVIFIIIITISILGFCVFNYFTPHWQGDQYIVDTKPIGEGLHFINGVWYLFDKDGKKCSGWYQDGDKWRYYSAIKGMLTNQFQGNYYLDENGVMVTDCTITINNYKGEYVCTFGSDGNLIHSVHTSTGVELTYDSDGNVINEIDPSKIGYIEDKYSILSKDGIKFYIDNKKDEIFSYFDRRIKLLGVEITFDFSEYASDRLIITAKVERTDADKGRDYISLGCSVYDENNLKEPIYSKTTYNGNEIAKGELSTITFGVPIGDANKFLHAKPSLRIKFYNSN